MQKNFEYCGTPFSFQRSTRKYCSDNCKQMAYFSRNGFTPANGSTTKSKSTGYRVRADESFTVKDVKVKYTSLNGIENDKNHDEFTVSESELEKVMGYAKCLIRNLLHLSDHQHVERDTFLEFTATWSQFVRWRCFLRTKSQFQSHSLMLELEGKLNALVKVHKHSDVIEFSLSQELGDQLNDSMDEMEYIRTIKFDAIRF